MRCEDCQKKVFHEQGDLWSAWHGLYVMVDTLEREEAITESTQAQMIDYLLRLKFLVSEYEERHETENES